MRRTQRLTLLGIIVLCLALAACGSRRPVSDFVSAANGTQPGAAQGQGNQAGPGGQPGTGTQPIPGVANSQGAGGPAAKGPGGGGAVTGSGGAGTGTAKNAAGSGTGPGGPNTASGPGVTPTQIYVGNIVTKSGSFGPDQFTSFYYGAAAYFDMINAQGGIHGRKVVFETCDDGGSAAGDNKCARGLAGDGNSGVFTFVGNDCLVCDGLRYVASKCIPQIGGVAIDFVDYALPCTWRYSGDMYPQNGQIGYKGNLYEGTQMFHYFKTKFGITKAGVLWYSNSSQSAEAGQSFVKGLQAEGIQAKGYGVNVGLPQWDSYVIDMKAQGITAVWDALDVTGNQNLCKSIDSNHLVLKAKVSTVSTWTQQVGQTFHYPCRTYIYSVEQPGTLGYDQTSNPEIAKFRAAMKRYFPTRENSMFEWNVDGWASAMWFADAASSCGANLTRPCVINYLNRPQPYAAHGIWWPRNNQKFNFDTKKTYYQCISVSHWDDSRHEFVTIGDFHNTCFTTPYIPYAAPTSSSS